MSSENRVGNENLQKCISLLRISLMVVLKGGTHVSVTVGSRYSSAADSFIFSVGSLSHLVYPGAYHAE